MKKKWGDNRMKKLYSEMWGKTVWGDGGRGGCEDSEGNSVYDGSL